ncbi:MAG: thioredoxin fold domain-containing protein [Thermodesulfobacteriota bacterium]
MKKENILVLAIICISIVGTLIYFNSKPDNHANANSVAHQATSSIEQKEIITAAKTSGIDWQSYAKGLDIAKAQDKPLFLYFHADWCTYCKKLKKTTFADKAVLNYLNDNFISITIDTDKEQAFASQWGIKGLPSLWFLKSDSSKISNLPGYVGPEQFLTILKYIRTQSYEKMSFSDFVKTI